MTGIARKRSANRYDEQRQMGIAAGFLMQKGDFRPRLAETLEHFEPAIWHRQVMYFQDDYGLLCAIAVYATLTERVERKMLADRGFTLHDTEWNEGERYWILAVAVRRRGLRAALRSLRAEMAKLTDVVHFRRTRPDRTAGRAWAIQTRGDLRPRHLDDAV